MRKKPNAAGPLFNITDLRWLAATGAITTLIILIAFAAGQATGNVTLARTLAFTASIFVQQFIYLNLQARHHSVFSSLHRTTWWLPLIGILPMVIHLVLLSVPLYQQIFSVAPLPPGLLIFVIVLSGSVMVISEINKVALIRRRSSE